MAERDGNQTFGGLRHPLLSKAVVIGRELTDDAGEDAEEMERLLAALVEDLQPRGVTEEMLVEVIAVMTWRLRRLLMSEAAEVAERVAKAATAATKATDPLDEATAEYQEMAEQIHRRGRLTRAERTQYGKDATVESVVARLQSWADIRERESTQRWERIVQAASAPVNLSGNRVRFEAHLQTQIHKALRTLQQVRAARETGEESGTKRKPRRGASRAQPKFLHVVK